MTATAHPVSAPVDRDAVFARWERRLALIHALRRGLPTLMALIAAALVVPKKASPPSPRARPRRAGGSAVIRY